MDNKQINQLLDRYFEGLTTTEEEDQLRTFFRKEDLPELWRPYQVLFQELDLQSAISLPTAVEKEVLRQIEAETPPRIRRFNGQALLRYAAAVALLFLALNWWSNALPGSEPRAGIDWSQYEPATPEEAALVYKEAILKLSTALNKGTNSAAKNVKRVETLGLFFE